jgi:hypothetical protein
MRSLSETQFWFVAAGVALTPVLTLWIADGIGWFLRRTLWSPEVEPQSGREQISQISETLREVGAFQISQLSSFMV